MHELIIGNSTYFVQGIDTKTLTELVEKFSIKYDKLQPSKLSPTQTTIRSWKIGELAEYIKNL